MPLAVNTSHVVSCPQLTPDALANMALTLVRPQELPSTRRAKLFQSSEAPEEHLKCGRNSDITGPTVKALSRHTCGVTC